MFISKKKYSKLVEERDYWRKQSFEVATMNLELLNLNKRILDNNDLLIEKLKEKINDQT